MKLNKWGDNKAYLVLYYDKDLKTKCVSHGTGNNSLKTYILSPDPIRSFPCKRDNIGLYIEV